MAGLVSPLGHACEFDVRITQGVVSLQDPLESTQRSHRKEHLSPNTSAGTWSKSRAQGHVGSTPGPTLGAAQPPATPCPRAAATPVLPGQPRAPTGEPREVQR